MDDNNLLYLYYKFVILHMSHQKERKTYEKEQSAAAGCQIISAGIKGTSGFSQRKGSFIPFYLFER